MTWRTRFLFRRTAKRLRKLGADVSAIALSEAWLSAVETLRDALPWLRTEEPETVCDPKRFCAAWIDRAERRRAG